MNPSRILVSVVLVAFAGPALAQASQSSLDAVAMLLDKLNEGISAFSQASSFVALGKRIAAVLFGVVVIWSVIKSMALGGGVYGQLVGDLVQPTIVLGLTIFAITNGLAQAVSSSVLALAGALGSTVGVDVGSLGITGSALEMRILLSFFEAGFRVLDSQTSDLSFMDGITGLFKGEAWGQVVALSVGFLARIVAMLMMMLCGAIGAGVIIAGKVGIAIALAFAPVMIPWGMWQPTAFIFASWLRFTLSSSMQVVMALAIGSLLQGAAITVAELGHTYTGFSDSLVISGGLILFGGLCMYLMFQAQAYASGLLSGDGTMGLQRWTAPAVAAGRGAQVVRRGASDAYDAGRHTMRGLFQGARSAWARTPSEVAAPFKGSTAAAGISGAVGSVAGATGGGIARATSAFFPGSVGRRARDFKVR